MFKISKLITLVCGVSLLMVTAFTLSAEREGIPQLVRQGTATQLHVDGSPFLIRGGELHNSTASSIDYMDPLWDPLVQMNLNTILATITWEQFEPQEGAFDTELITYLVEEAAKRDLKLIIVWFASWKNGQSSYAPLWVKQDTARFPRVLTVDGRAIETLSPFSDELKAADSRAFSKLLATIREVDRDNTVVMVQPENEVGLFQDIDYNENSVHGFLEGEVPEQFISYLVSNDGKLRPELQSLWDLAGKRKDGSWIEVFGDNPQAREIYTTWQYATFIDYVAASGKREYALPMFVNAWIVQAPEDLPGVYPNGGPVSRVMDVYKAGAPNIDFLSPDIYLPNYKEIVGDYVRSDNLLFVPESTRIAGRAFYTVAEHDGIGFAPFGIEDGINDTAFIAAYGVLEELESVILENQGYGRMIGVLRTGEEEFREAVIGDTRITVRYGEKERPSFGLIIQTARNEYVVAGVNFDVVFSSVDDETVTYIAKVVEGSYTDGKWQPGRWLNGDETFHNAAVRVLGRSGLTVYSPQEEEQRPPQPEMGDASTVAVEAWSVPTPAIYKVQTYQYEAFPSK